MTKKHNFVFNSCRCTGDANKVESECICMMDRFLCFDVAYHLVLLDFIH